MRALLAALGLVVAAAPAADDPAYTQGSQWGLTKIRAEAAWSVTRGRGAIVAVLDTGVDRRHPDLRANLLPGRDFADDDADPQDDNGHGTLVAGIIAAVTSNGTGVASVAPEAKILPVRVLGSDGTGSSRTVADGIRWAVEQGADVVNLSLAEEPAGNLADGLLRDPAVDRAIRDAATSGATVVVVSGNDASGGKPETAYDATTPGVVVVGASTRDDRRAAYANYGAGLDVVAPGGGSATDPRDAACTERTFILSTWWNPRTQRSEYGGTCGTSMAAAFVSGIAALLHTRGLTNDEIVDRIERTADDVGAPGRDAQTGAGRVNAARALGVQTTSRSSPTTAPTRTVPSGRPAATASAPASAVPSPTFRSPDAASRAQARRDPEPVRGENGVLPWIAAVLLALAAGGQAWVSVRGNGGRGSSAP